MSPVVGLVPIFLGVVGAYLIYLGSPPGGRIGRRNIRLQRIGLALVLLGCALQAVLLFPAIIERGLGRGAPNGEAEKPGYRTLSEGRLADLPARVGPAEFSAFGAMIAVRCPSDLDPLMRQAGGLWEPGSRRWLIERKRMGPQIRNLRRVTDPLFRHAGIDLDEQ